MFNLSQKNAVDRPILKCNFNSYTLPSLYLVNGEYNQVFTDIPREYSAISLKNSQLELDFSVTLRACAHNRYVDIDHVRLVNFEPIAILNNYRLTSSSAKR